MNYSDIPSKLEEEFEEIKKILESQDETFQKFQDKESVDETQFKVNEQKRYVKMISFYFVDELLSI